MYFKCVATVGLLSVFLTANFAAARDNDDKKDRSNQGGRSSSSSSNSSNNSGSSGSSSSRRRSHRVATHREVLAREAANRSKFQTQIARRARSAAAAADSGATFSGKSFSGSSSRSSDNNSSTTRSSGSQTVARPIDGAISNGNGGNAGSPFQGFSRGNASGGNTGNSDNSSPRTFSNGSNNSSPFNRFSDNSPNVLQTDRSSDNNSNLTLATARKPEIRIAMETTATTAITIRTPGSARSTVRTIKRATRSCLGTCSEMAKTDNRFGRSQSNQPGNQSNTLGPGSKLTKEKVDDFLQLRRDNASNSSNGSGDRNGGGKFNRNGNLANDGPNPFKSGQLGSQKSLADSKNDADQAWLKRFGKSDDGPGKCKSTAAMAKTMRRPGIVNLHGNNPNGPDRKFDKAYIDRNYQDWRKNAFDNKRGGDADHRDWSGQWKNGDRFVAADQIRDHWKKNGKGNGKDIPFSQAVVERPRSSRWP